MGRLRSRAAALAVLAVELLIAGGAPAQQPVILPGERDLRPAHEAEQRRREEIEMLARARAEARRGAEPATAGSAGEPLDPGEAIRRQAIEAEVERRVRAAERDVELEELAEAQRRRAAARGALPSPAPADIAGAGPLPPVAGGPELANRATVLLEIRPGSRGIRRLERTADPVLCTAHVCWISRGLERDAHVMPRYRALGTLNTFSGRAGACNDRVACVFRNIDLGATATTLQPIDLRLMEHDYRMPREVAIDASCRLDGGLLVCANAQAGPDYRLWVVPEAVAQAAGGRVLWSTLEAAGRLAERSPRR